MTNQNDKLNKGDDVIIVLHGNLNSSEQEKVKGFAKEALAIDEDGVTCISHGAVFTRRKEDDLMNIIHLNSSRSNIATAIYAAYVDHKEQGDEQTFVQIFIDHITEEDLVETKAQIAYIAEEVKETKSFKIQFLGLASISSEVEASLIALDDNLVSEGVNSDIVDYALLSEFATLEEAINHSLND